MTLKFHLTASSSNAKTGPIPVSTSSRDTCPSTCPFRGNGCYADSGPLAIHWNRVTAGDRGLLWGEFLAQILALPRGTLWRHNQAGDLWRPGTVMGRMALEQLTEANRGKRGFTYSHHVRTEAVRRAFRAATANGFTVNASCGSEREADAAMAYGLRAVFVVPRSDKRRFWSTEGGNRAVKCPAQALPDKGITCATCQLCQSRPSNVAIVFEAHGSGARKAEAALGPQPVTDAGGAAHG